MFNILHPDKSIKIDDKTNIIVSPYINNFYDEIEDGIKEAVKVLLDMGYLTIGSCDGFHIFKESAHVVVVVNSRNTAYELMYDLAQLGIYSNINITFDHFGIDNINKLFMRNYTEYTCVKIYIYRSRLITSPFKKYIIKKNTKLLKQLKRYIA
jgi:hypothetical protein